MATNLRKRFGRRLRTLRRLKDMTQEELAEAAGISVNFVGLIECGKNAPSFDTITRIAEALGVKEAELFMFEDMGAESAPEGKSA